MMFVTFEEIKKLFQIMREKHIIDELALLPLHSSPLQHIYDPSLYIPPLVVL